MPTLLFHLSTDVLRLILDDDCASYAITLWKCGNTRMNNKICNALTSVRLKSAGIAFSRFPLMLTQLPHLRTLTIKSAYKLMNSPTMWPQIMTQLSTKLETLQIVAPDAHSVLLNLKDGSSSECLITACERGPSRLIDMERYMPNLKSLKLKRTQKYQAEASDIEPSDFAGLPSSLTSLDVFVALAYPSDAPDAISLLPKNLTRLGGTIFPQTVDLSAAQKDWQRAPASLTSIGKVRSADDYKWLPRGMEYDLIEPPRFSEAELLRSMPPKLKEFSACDMIDDGDWVAALPRQLSTLEIYLNKIYFSLGENTAHLPRSLTRIRTATNGGIEWDPICSAWNAHKNSGAETSFWPPGIEDIFCPYGSIDLRNLYVLPQTLKTLDFELSLPPNRNDDGSVTIDLKQFPPGLTALTLYIRENQPLTFNIINAPSSLIEFGMEGTPPLSISRESFESLPATITLLSLGAIAVQSTDVDAEIPWKFPQALTSLRLSAWPFAWFSSLPRSLTSLWLNHAAGFTPDAPNVINGNAFLDLPRNLKTLSIAPNAQQNSPSIPMQRLSHLTQLHTLQIAGIGKLPSRMIRELPQSLRSLGWELEPIELEDAPFIPPRLTYFGIGYGRKELTPEIAEYWPLLCIVFVPDKKVRLVIERRLALLE